MPEDFCADGVELDYLSSLSVQEALSLVGKTIVHVEAAEHVIRFKFSDGSGFVARGNTYNGCALDVRYKEKYEETI